MLTLSLVFTLLVFFITLITGTWFKFGWNFLFFWYVVPIPIFQPNVDFVHFYNFLYHHCYSTLFFFKSAHVYYLSSLSGCNVNSRIQNMIENSKNDFPKTVWSNLLCLFHCLAPCHFWLCSWYWHRKEKMIPRFGAYSRAALISALQ